MRDGPATKRERGHVDGARRHGGVRGQRIEMLALDGAFHDGDVGAAERIAEGPVDVCVQRSTRR